MGASAPSAGLRYFGSIGRALSSDCRCAENDWSLLRLRFVAHRDEGLECRLEVEPLVFVHLVRADRRFDGGVELHPGDVARVVVVGEEAVRPGRQELLQRRLRGQLGGFAKQRRGERKLSLILHAVGDGGEAGRRAADRREEAGRAGLLLAGQRVDPALDLLLGGARGIEVGPVRFGGRARDEDAVVIQARPGPLVDQKIVQAGERGVEAVRVSRTTRGARPGDGLAREILEHGFVARPGLPHEEAVHQLRGVHEPGESAALAVGQRRDVGADVGRREPGGHGGQFPVRRNGCSGRGLLGHVGVSRRREEARVGKRDR